MTHSRVHLLPTGDGWPVALYEYEPQAAPRATPVLLCHGSFCRANFFDLGAGVGLAPWLAQKGYHVFSLELRGRGLTVPRKGDKPLHGRRWAWSVDDFVAFDLPAAIGAVSKLSGARRLDYLGHSLGGVIAFAHLLQTADARIRRVIAATTLSPVTIAKRWHALSAKAPAGTENLLRMLHPLTRFTPKIPIHWGAITAALVSPEFMLPLQPAMNANNIVPEIFRRYMRYGVVPVSSAKLRSLERWFTSPASPWKTASLARYDYPTFWFGGKKDRLVPPAWVRADYEYAGGEAAGHRHIEFSRQQGFAADYGHGDILLGRHVAHEVYPEIDRWLRSDAKPR